MKREAKLKKNDAEKSSGHKFWRFAHRSPSGPGRWIITPADPEWDWKMRGSLREGVPLAKGKWPSPSPRFTYEKLTTFQDLPWPGLSHQTVISDRLRELLEAAAPGAVQFLPITIHGPRSDEAPGPYWIMNCLRVFKCMVREPEIDSSRIPSDGVIGRIAGDSRHKVIIRGDIKSQIEKAGLTGVEFEKLHDVGVKKVRVNRTTGKRETVDPALDPESGAFDVDAYFAAGKGANDIVSASDETAFHTYVRMASARDILDVKVVKRFLKEGADPNAGNDAPNLSALIVMLDPKTPEILRALAAHGADVNSANTINGMTATMSAASDCNYDACKELLKLGANVNQQDVMGRTALHHIVDDGCNGIRPSRVRDIVELLIKHGANLELADHDGQTPLATAVTKWSQSTDDDDEGRHDDVARWLLDAGANPDCRFGPSRSKLVPNGGTPLMCQRYGDGKLHIALLKAGAEPSLKCPKGKTAIEYAEKRIAAKAADAPGAAKALKAMRA